ncbi:MAG TPA: hypothetical protein VF545_06410 [Thermoleophilaceae bacterium]|jgi:tetratricopeptide (TPR) repeat protein
MAKPPARDAAGRYELDVALEFYSDLLGAVADVVDETTGLLDERFAQAETRDPFNYVGGTLRGVRQRAEIVARAAEGGERRVVAVQREWHARRRWTEVGLDDLAAELAGLRNEPVKAGRRWVAEFLDALDAQGWDPVMKIVALEVPWPERLRAGVARIARDLAAWRDGDAETGLGLMSALGEPKGFERWEPILGPELRSRALRLAAWIAVRDLGDREIALRRLDEAVELYPYGGRMHAERAAYFLSLPDFGRAATNAQHAIERSGEDANGFLELGIWAELTGDYEAADAFYANGLEAMPSFEIAGLVTRASFVDPPGRLLGRAAEVLNGRGRYDESWELSDWALLAHVRGTGHPKAFVHRLRSELILRRDPAARAAAAAEAVAAGELFMWSGKLADAIERLERARSLDPVHPRATWLLVDALVTESLPPGAVVPDTEKLVEARETWDAQYTSERGGPPTYETSWAYLTRATIADLETQAPGGDREAGIWEALAWVEQSLVHDDSDAQRWGFASQYLRYAGLERLAQEAANRGHRIKPGDRRVMIERLAIATADGSTTDAEAIAREFVTTYGEDPTVSAFCAQIAMQRQRWEEAIDRLEFAFAAGSDPLWYLDMLARCHVALGQRKRARDNYREMLRRKQKGDAPTVGGLGKCRLVGAAAMVRSPSKAARWMRLADEDATAPAFNRATAEAWRRLGSGDRAGAGLALERAALAAPNRTRLDDLRVELNLRRRLLENVNAPHAGSLERALARARRTRAEQLRQLEARERKDPDVRGDDELADALTWVDAQRWGDNKFPSVAILAVAARRHLHRGRWAEAASCYDRIRALADKEFDPEASIGLARAIRFESEEHAERGDVEAVARLQTRLEALGVDTTVDSALALAMALAASGRPHDAIEHLRERLSAAADDAERHALHRRLGWLELGVGNCDGARGDLATARDLAYARRRFGSAARLEIMLAALALLDGDQPELELRLDAAAAALGGGADTGVADIVAHDFVELATERNFPKGRRDPAAAARRWAHRAGRPELGAEIAARARGKSSGPRKTIS